MNSINVHYSGHKGGTIELHFDIFIHILKFLKEKQNQRRRRKNMMMKKKDVQSDSDQGIWIDFWKRQCRLAR